MPKSKSRAKKTARLLNNITSNEAPSDYIFDNADDLIAAFNPIVAIVPIGNEMYFAFTGPDGKPILRSKHAAEIALGKYRWINAKGKLVSAFSVWCTLPERREYTRAVFNPNPKKVGDTEFNLFTGWAVEPAEGDCSLFLDHVLNNVCKGDKAINHYFLAVLAQMFQEPERKIGIAIALLGGMGVGKTVVADCIGHIVGDAYSPVIDKPDQLTGKFRGQLEHAIFARIEEGYYPGDHECKATFKHLVTGETLLIERKGRDAYQAPNFTRFFITSNGPWVVPAGVGERRVLFLEVGDGRKQDGAYFSALKKQMDDGGYAALLHHLMTYDYSDVDFTKPPITIGLLEQIKLGFTAEERWLESVLTEGRFPFKDDKHDKDDIKYSADLEWPDEGALTISKDLVTKSYRDFVPGYRSPPTPQQVGAFLRRRFPGISEQRTTVGTLRMRYWVFPAIKEMREAFVKLYPGYVFPKPEPEKDPQTEPKQQEKPAEDAGHVVPIKSGMRRSRFL